MICKKLTILTASAALGFTLGAFSAHGAERYDMKVRNDFFAGFLGNAEALQRALAGAEATLKEEPNHAEALVWHGGGLYFLAGEAFRKGDAAKGMELAMKGLAEMQRAVDLAPENPGVRVPRGAVLLTASRFQPPAQAKPLIELGVGDFEATLRVQAAQFHTLGEHPRGELLLNLGDGYSRLGRQEEAQGIFERILRELPATAYAKRAETWMEKKSLTAREAQCIGCHVSK
ncbi:MAG: hypothetical protein FJW40_05350 [Acidobacteria bacterium]|nr:hypothetical protein [Acidobacteriota bacterium]